MTTEHLCPDPARLAAFVDGKLGAGDRELIVLHLDGCAACYETVAEAAQLVEDLADECAESAEPAAPLAPSRVVPFRRPRVLFGLGGLAAAALLVLAFRIPLLGLLGPGPLPGSADLLEPWPAGDDLAGLLAPGWDEHGWTVFRGGGTPVVDGALAFRIGVQVVDVEVAARAATGTRREVEEMVVLLGRVELAEALVAMYRQLAVRAESGELTVAERTQAESLVALHLDSERFDLARWAEAGRIAARIGDVAFFAQRRYRGVPSEFASIELPEEARRLLSEVELDLAGVETVGLGPVESHLASLIRELGS